MAGKLSDYSPANRLAVYRCVGLEVYGEVQEAVADLPNDGPAMQRVFRSPMRLIDAAVDFNRRHSQACIEKAQMFPGIDLPNPWAKDTEDALRTETLAVLKRVCGLVRQHWQLPDQFVAVCVDNANHELQQRISMEYEAGRDALWQALRGLKTATPTTPEGDAADHPPPAAAMRSQRKLKRGATAAERLREYWNDPKKRQELLAAGNAERIGDLIGRGKTQVIKAGKIWDDKILPALKAQRSMVQYHRQEERPHR